ncbi:MAG TPA: ATP-binding protein, partial [Lysobacter sp.]
ALATAVLDPVIYSAWLAAGGESSILVIGFYIFTTLGFGFRIGPRAMRICQSVSILGFAGVLVLSPFWKSHPFFGLSHFILLVAVPMYAGTLMRELRDAKARAEHESRAKNQLLANVSHELRTPLTGIVSAAELLEAGSRTRESDRLVATILKLSASLGSEIDQLLDLSRLGVQTSSGAPVPFDLRTVTSHVQAALQETAAGKGIEFVVEVDPAIDRAVLGRPRDLESVLMNLVGNAVKFTPDGSVRLDVKLIDAEEGAYRLWFGVTDTGIGIPLEHQDKLFEPFYRVETGDRRQYRGTGLGTTIASEHVRRMGGELELSSAPGQGSMFWFEISLPTAQMPAASNEAQAPAHVSPKRILVADDNGINLELLQQMLLKDGHEVTSARNGTEALQHLASGDFDVVMLDFNMGDIDGLTVYQSYAFGRLDPAPTFFVTADTSSATAARLNQAGTAGIVYKPLTFDKLRQALLSVFPDEAAGVPAAPRAAVAAESAPPPVRLAAVPVEYVDPSVVQTLREIKDQPAFVHAMLGDGMDDLRALLPTLTAAIQAEDLSGMHLQAHAMKGVALSIGAVRLANLCERLMKTTPTQLASSRDRLLDELTATVEASLVALKQLRAPFASGASKSA